MEDQLGFLMEGPRERALQSTVYDFLFMIPVWVWQIASFQLVGGLVQLIPLMRQEWKSLYMLSKWTEMLQSLTIETYEFYPSLAYAAAFVPIMVLQGLYGVWPTTYTTALLFGLEYWVPLMTIAIPMLSGLWYSEVSSDSDSIYQLYLFLMGAYVSHEATYSLLPNAIKFVDTAWTDFSSTHPVYESIL